MNGEEKSTKRNRDRPVYQNREETPQRREPGRRPPKGSLKSFIDENRSLDILALFTKIYARL